MKVRVVWRKVVHYIRTDLKEIAFPSSLPDPPSSKPKPRKLRPREHLQVWKKGTTLYLRSWKTGTFDDSDDEEAEEKAARSRPKEKSPDDHSIVEELALAARAGSDHLRPALQRVYMTRAAAYRDALQSFVRGYQEGLGEVMADFKAMNGKNPLEKEEAHPKTETAVFPPKPTQVGTRK